MARAHAVEQLMLQVFAKPAQQLSTGPALRVHRAHQ